MKRPPRPRKPPVPVVVLADYDPDALQEAIKAWCRAMMRVQTVIAAEEIGAEPWRVTGRGEA